MSYQIFISLRFAEAGREANALKNALEARGISTFLCAVLPGVDISSEIAEALHGCQLAIIMGTKTYGKNTGVGFSTFEELRYIYEQKKPFFLVKMCDRFEEHQTVFRLGNSVSYLEWLPPRPMPGDLISKIVERLASVAGGFSSTEQRNPVYFANLSESGKYDQEHDLKIANQKLDLEVKRPQLLGGQEHKGSPLALALEIAPEIVSAPLRCTQLYFIGEAFGPHRIKVSSDQTGVNREGWKQFLSFRAFPMPKTGTTRFIVGHTHSPPCHRFFIFSDKSEKPDEKFEFLFAFWAFSEAQDDTAHFSVGYHPEPYRHMIKQQNGPLTSGGWKPYLSFYAYT
jgi:hypothetical protein